MTWTILFRIFYYYSFQFLGILYLRPRGRKFIRIAGKIPGE